MSITIFGLGIMPYISASIIFQLLGSVWGPLERLQKEGESGRKKINEYTRYATVVICLLQSWLYVKGILIGDELIDPLALRSGNAIRLVQLDLRHRRDDDRRHRIFDVAGRADRRIRNRQRHQLADHGRHSWPACPAPARIMLSNSTTANSAAKGASTASRSLLVLHLAVHRRGGRRGLYHAGPAADPHAKRQARPRTQGLSAAAASICRLHVNQAGVMPIIFASSLLLFPQMVFRYFVFARPRPRARGIASGRISQIVIQPRAVAVSTPCCISC